MAVGFLREADGAWSARRILATLFALSAVVLFIIAAIIGKIEGVYGGAICVIATVLLMFFTTWSDIKGVVQAARGGGGS